MPTPHHDDIKRKVRETYGKVATAGTSGCGCSCSTSRGYSQAELDSVPKGADMGLGSGNPLAVADIQPGETVLDLGSGGGVDCFLAFFLHGIHRVLRGVLHILSGFLGAHGSGGNETWLEL